MALQNTPRTTLNLEDGNNLPAPIARAPRTIIVGTAAQGQGHREYYVSSTSAAKSEFGSDGNLIRGMWEATKSGAEEVVLYRIGCTPASLLHVGDSTGAAGYTITTVMEDDAAGAAYSIYYDDGTDRLVIRRNSDDLTVFDNDSTNPIEDITEITVSGARAAAGGDDIGGPSSFINLEDVTSLSAPPSGVTFTAGTDGLNMSRMELYEELYVAYKDILRLQFDAIAPMDVFLDDYNVVNQGHYIGAVTPVLPGSNTYPTAGAYSLGTDVDSLGKVYVEKYEGQYYFWWDINGDGTADIYPSAGSADATHKIDGTTLSTADFHEVNFAYQLARFLYDHSKDIIVSTGAIGVLPPASNGIVDRARWLGEAPTWTQDNSTGVYSVASSADNGKGLLGNKFMVGMSTHRSGIFGGGFILTDTEFMDGTEQVDTNDIPIDLGKYISITADTVRMRNNWLSSGYYASFAASYTGMYPQLAPQSAPTNKNVSSSIALVFGQSLPDLDLLMGAGYVVLRNKEKGLVVADAPVATMPNSDYNRLSTVRIVKAIVDAIRRVADPYLGEGMSSATKATLKEKIEKVLMNAKTDQYLVRYEPFTLIQTPSMAVAGRASVKLVLRPAFELRELEVNVALTK